MPLLPLPSVVRRADDLLPSARTLLDDFAARCEVDPAIELSCGAGCTACCHQAVPASPAETRSIVAALDRLDPADRAKIERRAADAVATLEAAGITADDFVGDRTSVRTASLRYYELGLPCPLLDEDLCVVHPDRPLACRQYLMASDPAHCTTIDVHPERLLHIRPRSDVMAGFRLAASELGESGVRILALSLADALSSQGPPQAPLTEPRSGPSMAAQLTSVPT